MTRHTDETRTDRRTMRAVSHTNPYTGETTGQLFRRGPITVADGGRRDAIDPDGDRRTARPTSDDGPDGTAGADGEPDGERVTMREVSHTPPNESDDANRVFERGGREAGADSDRGESDPGRARAGRRTDRAAHRRRHDDESDHRRRHDDEHGVGDEE